MVQNTLQRQASLEAFGKQDDISVADVLTPTTIKNITQILESDNCIKKIQCLENGEEVFTVPELPQLNKAPKKKNLIKLETTQFQGGTVIIGTTPTKSENLSILDPPPAKIAPESPTTMTMKTRSSSRTKATAFVQPRIQTPQIAKTRQANVKRTPVSTKSRPGVKSQKYVDDDELSAEEAERLRIRRERNKAAAARCRKRRMDTISTLEHEVEQHEKKKRAFEREIAELRNERDQLQYILQQHQSECKFTNENFNNSTANSFNTFAVKSEPVIVEPMYVLEPTANPVVEVPANAPTKLKPKRPLTLTISQPTSVKTTSATGIDIETPSNVLISMGFDNLMTSTGLTPTSNIITPISFPSCSSQQRTSEGLNDLSTPSTENLSLVSL